MIGLGRSELHTAAWWFGYSCVVTLMLAWVVWVAKSWITLISLANLTMCYIQIFDGLVRANRRYKELREFDFIHNGHLPSK